MSATLVLGGARSGKSAFAQAEAEAAASRGRTPPLLIATAEALDAEMEARIRRHQAERASLWRTLEAPLALCEALRSLGPTDVAVVDCLTLWLSNLLMAGADVAGRSEELVRTIAATPAALWLVSNEVGLGLVPETALGRRFRDEAGRLHQGIAKVCPRVVFVAAGLPLVLKPSPA